MNNISDTKKNALEIAQEQARERITQHQMEQKYAQADQQTANTQPMDQQPPQQEATQTETMSQKTQQRETEAERLYQAEALDNPAQSVQNEEFTIQNQNPMAQQRANDIRPQPTATNQDAEELILQNEEKRTRREQIRLLENQDKEQLYEKKKNDENLFEKSSLDEHGNTLND